MTFASKIHRKTARGLAGKSWEQLFDVLSSINSFFTNLRRLIFSSSLIRRGTCARVVSIGNILAGGAGKTPMTDLIVRNGNIDETVVLIRGYGSDIESGPLMHDLYDDSKVHSYIKEPSSLPDEGVELIRRNPGLKVISGKYRAVTGVFADKTYKPSIIIMDDGLQYARLEKDCEIVMIDGQLPFPPRGLRRDKVSVLKKADAVVITRADKMNSRLQKELKKSIGKYGCQNVFFAVHKAFRLYSLCQDNYGVDDLEEDNYSSGISLNFLKGRRVAACCGIASPESFVKTLENAQSNVVYSHFWEDHTWEGAEKLKQICMNAGQAGAECVIVTSKDASRILPDINIKPGCWTQGLLKDMPLPVMELRIQMELLDYEEEFFNIVCGFKKAGREKVQ